MSEFIEKFDTLANQESIIDFFLQISTDEGDELELDFFTEDKIIDLTLSKGKICSCSYLLSTVQSIEVKDLYHKWVLIISGDKKFDYNVVKPNSTVELVRYSKSLKSKMGLV